jgi:acylphosphatase
MAGASIRLLVEGRVQGVGFRWWVVGEAQRLGLKGWVRNRRDGSVEILAIGETEALDRLAERCAEGPPGSSVARVSREPAADDASVGFEQWPTV